MEHVIFAVCTYNRAARLPRLIASMRAQQCRIPYEILVVDNNSTDETQRILAELAAQDGAPLRIVREEKQGIPFARNRAIAEAMESTYLVFIDDDEIPLPGLLDAAVSAMSEEGADSVGGRVTVVFDPVERPCWLGDELLGFLAEIDYGDTAFWISDDSTPIWTANVGYRMALFRDDPRLRFDQRYNRRGKAIGGGSDRIMFLELLRRKIKMRYRPDMLVEHYVEPWRLTRGYFLKLHFISGRKTAQFESPDYPRTIIGVPLFMFPQALRQMWKTLFMIVTGRPKSLRQAMNASHAVGYIWGRMLRWHEGRAQKQ